MPLSRSASIREARVEDCPSLRNLPENLRWHRRIRDLSQANLAALSGFAQQYISALERGLRPSDPCHVEALAQALGLSPKTLLRRPRSLRSRSASDPVASRGLPVAKKEQRLLRTEPAVEENDRDG